MRKLSYFAAIVSIALSLTSCEPEVFSMFLDMRSASPSGLDLTGKTMSVIYMDDLSGKDTVFNANVAQGFARALEEDYFDGREAVAIYKLEKDMAGDYSSKDSLVNYAIESGDDVIFMFDSPVFEDFVVDSRKPFTAESVTAPMDIVEARAPYRIKMYAYDTMAERDTVRTFSGYSIAEQTILCKSDVEQEDLVWEFYDSLSEVGSVIGERSAKNFLSTWTPEKYSFYHSSTPYKWEDASVAAYECRWKDAIDIWMSLLNTKNVTKRAALEYNIAMAFYLIGDKDLTEKWLELSEKDAPLVLASRLKAKLLEK